MKDLAWIVEASVPHLNRSHGADVLEWPLDILLKLLDKVSFLLWPHNSLNKVLLSGY